MIRLKTLLSSTYIEGIDSVLDGHAAGLEVSILAHRVHHASHGCVGTLISLLGDGPAHVHVVIHCLLCVCFALLFIEF